jgi:hypothetical protein
MGQIGGLTLFLATLGLDVILILSIKMLTLALDFVAVGTGQWQTVKRTFNYRGLI